MRSRSPDRALRHCGPSTLAQSLHCRQPNSSPPRRRRSLSLQPSAYRDLLLLATKTQSLVIAKLVHSHMIRASYRPGIFMHNVLLNAYCRCGDLSDAHQLFDRTRVRDAATWNILAAGYARVGYGGRALCVFNEARNAAIALDRFSYAGALSACADCGDVKTGRIVHGMVIVNGLARRAFITNSLMDMYSKCGMTDEVRLVFDRAEELDEVSWNSLLSAYVSIGWPEVAVHVLVWMHRLGVKLNSFALGSILKACSEMTDSEDVRRMMHGCVTKLGLDLDLFVGSAMLDMYAKNGGLEEAIMIFECIPKPSLVVFNAMIAGFSRLGTESCSQDRVKALRLFQEMLRRQMKPSKFTFKSVLEACISLGALRCGRQIHAHIVMNSLQDDEFIGSALITLYSTSNLAVEALRCFQMSPKQETFTWTSMISAYTWDEQYEAALSLFKELLGLERKPEQFILSSVMTVCSHLGLLRIGEQLHGYAMKLGFANFTVCGNSLIDMYTKIGDLSASIKTYQDIGSLDDFSWSVMISSYALHGSARDGLMLFEKMKDCRVVPNHFTFLAVLTACSHGGFLDEGFRYYESMSAEYGLAPNSKHCACIIDLLGRAGRIADAWDFLLLRSGFSKDPILWHALLRACVIYGDIESAIHIGERLLIMEPLSATSYMQLYNMYMDVGKISLAMRTRGLMWERGVNKETGLCWIEIGASFDSFVTNSGHHPHMDAIYEKLQDILLHIKMKKGNFGLKILELEYQSKKWRESLMNSHIELLAVALGMTKLPESVPIRVMKNQRVCRECHFMLKLFSEIEKREIIVRDPVQFHHFSWGSCTCSDYW
ncbi:pentatricopeptide repeat-containing protein [Canna indica]|uniref:Pentatricopeptide repeat-containing protein n=1 Tax=Canna indica TaxID=4628 RepID=A0AAQ3K800_9LILI|nr:pentatricopeptide repeat-containing protein [Canna indica]